MSELEALHCLADIGGRRAVAVVRMKVSKRQMLVRVMLEPKWWRSAGEGIWSVRYHCMNSCCKIGL